MALDATRAPSWAVDEGGVDEGVGKLDVVQKLRSSLSPTANPSTDVVQPPLPDLAHRHVERARGHREGRSERLVDDRLVPGRLVRRQLRRLDAAGTSRNRLRFTSRDRDAMWPQASLLIKCEVTALQGPQKGCARIHWSALR